MIDAAEWLSSRIPAPPPELAERFARIADGRTCSDEVELSRFFVSEAAALLKNLSGDRSGALDLLVADSLITYAMEAAAENGRSVDAAATDAIQVIAATASRGGKA